jgi:Ca2+-binding EF-hand superfamily protein
MVSSINSYNDLSIAQLVARLDSDESGDIDENELVAKRPDGMTEAQARAAFQKMDSQNAGVLRAGDVASVFQTISSQMQASLIQAQAVKNTPLASSPAIAFSKADTDYSGDVNRDEFLTNLSGVLGESAANELWDEIVGGSGARPGMDSLTERQFVLGVRNASVSSSDVTAMQQLVSILSKVPDKASNFGALTKADPSELFWSLNTDGNGLVNRDEFIAGMSSRRINSEQAGAIWDQIAANSGTLRTSEGLTETQFVTGFGAVSIEGLEQSTGPDFDFGTMEKLVGLLKTQGSASYIDPEDAVAVYESVDSDGDQTVTQNEFLTAQKGKMSTSSAAELWANILAESGTGTPTEGLTSDQFIAGYTAAISTWNKDGQEAEPSTEALTSFLQNLRSGAAVPYNVGTTKSATLFARLDKDLDGLISQDDFVAARPGSIGITQASEYWAQITAQSGAASGDSLDQVAFSQGISNAGITLLDNAAISGLQKALTDLRNTTPTLYNMGADNPSDIYSLMDTDRDNSVSYADFMAARPSTVSAERAQAVWKAIVENSGNPTSTSSLAENEFVAGYTTLAGPSAQQTAMDQLESLLSKIGGTDATVDMGTTNGSDLFSIADSNADGYVSKDDFIAIRPSSVSASQASAYWDQIAANSQAEGASAGMAENEFVTGFYAEGSVSLASETVDLLLSMLDGTSTEEVPTENETAIVQFDADGNGMVSVAEFQTLRPSDTTEDDMYGVWDTLVANSGSADPAQGLTADEYMAALTSLTPESTATSSTERLTELLRSLGVSQIETFDKAGTNPSDLFAQVDSDQSGTINQQDFIERRPETMSEAQATTLWSLIQGNSGATDESGELTEGQFVTGYTLTSAAAIDDPTNYTTISKLLGFLETVRSDQAAPFDSSAYDAQALFSTMDGDGDGLVTDAEFRQNKPEALDEQYVAGAWQQIVANSGSADSSNGLTVDEFAAGFAYIDTAALEQTNSETVDAFANLLGDLLNGVQEPSDLQLSESLSMRSYLDVGGDGTLSRGDLMTGLQGIVSAAGGALDSAQSRTYALEQFLQAVGSYQLSTTGSMTTGLSVVNG